MNGFPTIDLSGLPVPDFVEPVDAQAALGRMVERFTKLAPEMAQTIQLESDPIRKAFQIVALEVAAIKAGTNNAGRAILRASATGADLHNLAALIPLEPDEGETDESFRQRMRAAPEAFSSAGPVGAYDYHVRRADPAITDVYVDAFNLNNSNAESFNSPAAKALRSEIYLKMAEYAALTDMPPPGCVHIYPLASDDGTVPDSVEANITAALGDDVRPATDCVEIKAPSVSAYQVEAVLTVSGGPGEEAVLAAAGAVVQSYVDNANRLNGQVTRAGLTAALVGEGVTNVDLLLPAADIISGAKDAPVCTQINITIGGAL